MDPQIQTPPSGLVRFLLNHKHARTFIFQFIACTMLMFFGTAINEFPHAQGSHKNPFALIYKALVLYMIVVLFGPITGAQINPAITVAEYRQKDRKKGDAKMAAVYIVAHFLGCFVGVVMARIFLDLGGPVYPSMPDAIVLGKGYLQQFMGTFIFVFFVIMLTNHQTRFVYEQAWMHLMIGMFFFFSTTFAGSFGIFNPAAIFALQIQGMINSSGSSRGFLCALGLMAVQFLAAVLAQVFFKRVYVVTVRRWKKQQNS